MIRRTIFLPLILALLAVGQPLQAAGESAKAFLDAIYAHYQGVDPEGLALSTDQELQHYFTPSLAQLMIADNKKAQAKGDVPSLDADPFVDAQDWEITDLAIAVEDAPKTTAKVSFKNTGKPVTVTLDLVKAGNSWQINDIHWPDGSLRRLYGQ